MDSTHIEIAVIGAGLSGLAFARFYLDTHPSCQLRIFEQDRNLGGVWSKDRVFDAFWTQSPLRMTSFSDIKLDLPEDAPQAYSTFPASYVSEYLEKYVDQHIYDGRTLRDRISCGIEVVSVVREGSKWRVQTKSAGNHTQTILCDRIAVASGLTSSPILPAALQRPGSSVEVLHHRDFGRHSRRILAADSGYRSIAVVGGGKSAADMVYAAVSAGKHISWIVREIGEGPGIFLNPASTARYDNHVVQAGSTRAATLLNPSAFRSPSWWAQLHHESEAGRDILRQRIDTTDQKCKDYASYRNREGALPGFRHLETNASFFWNSGPIGLIQRDDFWPLVSQNVEVYRGDVLGTAEQRLLLSEQRSIPADIVLCGTGWDAGYPFIADQLASQLGLPRPTSDDAKEDESWETLISQADRRILAQYPILGESPSATLRNRSNRHSYAAAKLYRGIVPLADSTIVFLGRSRLANNFRGSEAQAIWATALWDGRINLPSYEHLREDVAYHIAFSWRRYPTRGADGVNFHSDLIWYTDTLLTEAGLRSHRKLWWSDWDEPILASDFEDCAEEYIRNGRQKAKDNFKNNTH